MTGIELRLKNKFYEGTFHWKGIEYKGNHKVIIPPSILDRVKASFGKRGCKKRSPEEVGVFSGGWIRCAHPECQRPLIFDPKKRVLKTTGNVIYFPYYHCSNSRDVHGSLKGMNVNEEQLWEQFAPIFRNIKISKELAQKIADALNGYQETVKTEVNETSQVHESNIQALEEKRNKLFDLLMDNVITEDDYRAQITRIDEKRKNYSKAQEDSNLATSGLWMVKAKEILELATHAETVWKSGTPHERLETLKKACSNPRLDGLTLRYEIKKSLQVVSGMTENPKWCGRQESNLRPSDSKSDALSN